MNHVLKTSDKNITLPYIVLQYISEIGKNNSTPVFF